MQQLKASEVRPFRLALLEKQGGRCALCGEPLAPALACLDHNHATGQVRGVIHRACNSVLGKVENGRRFGKDFDILAFAAGLHRYLCVQQPYPLHPSFGAKVRRKRIGKIRSNLGS